MNGESRYLEVDRGKLHYRVVGSGQKTLVWVHGMPLNGESWSHQLPCFSDFRNLVLDLRGYGNSTKLPPDPGEISDLYVDDLKRLIQREAAQGGASIIGHASGGHGVIRFAARHPDLMERLVLINSSPKFRKGEDWPWGFGDDAIAAINQVLGEGDIDKAFQLLMSPDEVFKEVREGNLDDLLATYREMTRQCGMTTIEGFFSNISLDDDRHLLADIQAPTLLVHSPLDNEVRPEVGLFMRQQIPNALLVEIPDSDHFVFATRPTVTNELLRAFLDPLLTT